MASDRRAYVKIPDSILRESWDDATLADVVRLQSFLNTRWARDKLTSGEAGQAFLGAQEMMLITHTTNVTRARARLLALRHRSCIRSLSVVQASQGRFKGVRVKWKKFVKEQGYADRDIPQSRGKPGAADPSPKKQTQKQTQPQTKSRAARSDFPPWAFECSTLLIDLLRSIPGARIPPKARKSWAHEIALLAQETPELSENPSENIQGAIRWALGPKNHGQKYEVVIRSGRSLREKWPKLRAASLRAERDAPLDSADLEADLEQHLGGLQ